MNVEIRPDTRVSELPVPNINNEPREVLRTRNQARLLISNNELYEKLGLRFPTEVKIFYLSIQERLVRNEIIAVSDKVSCIKSNGILGFVKREIIKHHKKRIEQLNQAKEIIFSRKEKIVESLSPEERLRSHNIDLAANSLFKKAQEIHGTPLMPETILDDWIVNSWAKDWEEKFTENRLVSISLFSTKL
jgi:hypothetical protein